MKSLTQELQEHILESTKHSANSVTLFNQSNHFVLILAITSVKNKR